ncbi:protein kinase [Streptomyces sp. NPDC051018]|uniref:serine/threonine-protein kinase n=1 Tax=Streptomyces sp. NPDC051018 TaxID=3365639 RepID=UPI0037B1303F
MALRVLAGRYELRELLGRGGMGQVWAAFDTVIHRRVAVKLLHRAAGGIPEDVAVGLFFREARIAGALSHPGIVTVHDMGRDGEGGELYLVMELVAGRDLGVVLRQDGPPAVAQAVGWAVQTAEALAVAHAAGIVHRDLKPENLLLTPQGRVKVLDFGIARYLATVTTASRVVGTPAYMAPERLRGQGGPAADLYALGCVLYELLTGRQPFHGLEPWALMYAHAQQTPEPPGTHREGIPAALGDLVLTLLAKNPDHRPPTADATRTLLLTTLNDTGNSPRPATADRHTAATQPAPERRPSRRTAPDPANNPNNPAPGNGTTPEPDTAPGPDTGPAATPRPATAPPPPGRTKPSTQPGAPAEDTPGNRDNQPGKATDPAAAVIEYAALLSEQIRALGPDHPHTLTNRHSLAHWQGEAGDPAAAAIGFAELLPHQIRVLGPHHPHTLTNRHSLAHWQGQAGDPAAAVTGLAELLPHQIRVLGPDHPHTLATRHQLARWQGQAGDPAAAVAGFAELLPDATRVLGPDHPDTLLTRHSLAHWQGQAGDPAAAVAEYTALLPEQTRVLGPHHPDTLATRRQLAHWQQLA